MKKLLTAIVVATSLTYAGCASLDALRAVSSVEVTPKQAFAAIGTFDGLKVVAIQYVSLPLCDGVRIICRDLEASRILYIAVDEGTIARNELKRSARRGGTSGYTALSLAISSLRNTFAQYNIGRK